ncbi:MAG: pyruvate kinase [Eubacteriales bacterium]|nr:pyruvate kinase [Eubacteriales bacterium]
MIDIYGTLGPSCASEETLTEMFLAGMTGLRLNLSHQSLHESTRELALFRTAAQKAGVRPRLLVDLQGPELRIGFLKAPLILCEDDSVKIYDEGIAEEERLKLRMGGRRLIPVPGAVFAVLREGMEILLDDGRILLKVQGAEDGYFTARILRGGLLAGRKSIKIVDVDIQPPTMTAMDLRNIRDLTACGVTGVMQPFVRSREDLLEVRRALRENGAGSLQLVAKIENRAGLLQLEDLLPACDAICIARGDLGNDMDLWQLPGVQKQIAAACKKTSRYFMVATQMLDSMENRAVPTRAEVNDIFNTVLDGAGGVMATGETAVGKYPVDVIRYLARTAAEGERLRDIYLQ